VATHKRKLWVQPLRTKRTDRWKPIVGHNQSQPVRVASIGFPTQQEMANLFLLRRGSVKESSKNLLLSMGSLKATSRFLSLLSQNQLLDAMGMSKPKVVCKTCGGLWGTLGHNNRCPQKVYTLEGKFCECGEPATTTSAVSS